MLLLTQASGRVWVAGELRLLLAKHLAVIRIVFNEEDEESGEDEGKTAGAEEWYEVPESCRECRRRGEVRLDHCGRGQEQTSNAVLE